MIPLRDELKQEITEWNLVIRRITDHKRQNNISDGENVYLDAILSQAETNKEHIQKRIDNESNLVEAPVMQKIAEVIDKEIADYEREIKIWNDCLEPDESTKPMQDRKNIIGILQTLKLKIASNFSA